MATIGIIGSGDMGAGVAAALVDAGYRVVTDLTARSPYSRSLAERAGTEDVGSLRAIFEVADLVFSIVPPASAAAVAVEVAANLPARSKFADCNAIAPQHVRQLAQGFADSEAVIDVGIVGSPPQREQARGTRFFVSGAARERVLALAVPGIDTIDMGPELGRASAIKMVYAALNKGVDGLLTSILLAAGRLDVRETLLDELGASQANLLARMHRRIPYLAATAERFEPEMREIAAAFDAVGVTPDFHYGCAWLYGVLARSSLASETRDSLPNERSLDSALAAFDAALAEREAQS